MGTARRDCALVGWAGLLLSRKATSVREHRKDMLGQWLLLITLAFLVSEDEAKCFHQGCENVGGTCVMPGEPVPKGFVDYGKFCDRKLNCRCYVPQVKCFHKGCMKVGGTCVMPGEPVPFGYVDYGNFCNEKLNCKCYVPQTKCVHQGCKNVGGTCVMPGDSVPFGFVDYGKFCNKELNCRCYVP